MFLQRARSELRDCHGAGDHRCGQGNGGDNLTLFFKDETDLNHAAADPAEFLGDSNTEQISICEGVPEFPVDTIVARFNLANPIGGHHSLEDSPRHFANGFLFFVKSKIHDYSFTR